MDSDADLINEQDDMLMSKMDMTNFGGDATRMTLKEVEKTHIDSDDDNEGFDSAGSEEDQDANDGKSVFLMRKKNIRKHDSSSYMNSSDQSKNNPYNRMPSKMLAS